MGNGFALSGSAGAGGQMLQEIIKRRYLEQVQRQQLAEVAKRGDQQHAIATRGLDIQEQNIDATNALRRDTLASNDAFRDATLAATTAARESADADRDEARFGTQLTQLPTGSRISGQEAVRFAKYGANRLLKPTTTAGGDPEFEFTGTQQAQEHAATAKETARSHDLTNDAAMARAEAAQARAEAAAARGANAGANTNVQQVIGPDGKPALVVVDRGNATSRPVDLPTGFTPNRPARPVTGTERQALAFFNRMLQAERDARNVEGKLSQQDMAVTEAPLPGFMANFLRTREGQMYNQAQRAYTEARLRKESGAAINKDEYNNDRTMSFRMLGEKPETLAQKRRGRATTLRGLGLAAGRALQEHYGEESDLDALLAEFSEGGAPASRGGPAPAAANLGGATQGPQKGERRTISGQLAEWDGKGWKAVKP